MTPPNRMRRYPAGRLALENGHGREMLLRLKPGGAGRNGDPPRILIIGGSGFIGTNLAAQLARRGLPVTIFDNLSRPGVEKNLIWLQESFGERISLKLADVRDAAAVRRAVVRCDAVFHFAAQVAVTTSLCDPMEDFEINARGTLHVLEACRRCASPPPLLYTSTNKVYGNLRNLPLARDGNRYLPRDEYVQALGVGETQPLDFQSPYGCSKGVADQYVLDYARCWNLPAVVFRMSCIYGPHQRGTEDQGWVAHFVRSVLENEPITLYGDGRQVRDLLFVDDLVAAMVRAVENIDLTAGNAFNIGGGPDNAASLREVIDVLAGIHGRSAQVKTADWRPGDQRYYVSDIRGFEKQVGWRPRVGVEAGIRRLYDWMGSNVGGRSSALATL